jgi:DNA-binding response OmpR family regulator
MKVLIAEDDRPMREGIAELLEREGFEVHTAGDGDEALQMYRTERVDFVVLDIMMPKRSGYDVCKAIRAEDPRTPVMFLSAKSEEIDRVLGLELGADDYLMKPFGTRELVARMRAVARRVLAHAPSARVERFEMADLVVEPKELRARRDGALIELSVREVDLLRAFHAHAGQTLDRDQLYDLVWGIGAYPNSRTLDQHISKLRKKIERDPKSPRIIRTVHGAGYRFER